MLQFYIISKDLKKNFKYLPKYALEKVNIREGYQILSDIGHYYGVTWKFQNKKYNYNHPNVKKFCTYPMFQEFISHYEESINYKKDTIFVQKYSYFKKENGKKKLLAIIQKDNKYLQDIRYLLSSKKKNLQKNEIENLEKILFEK